MNRRNNAPTGVAEYEYRNEGWLPVFRVPKSLHTVVAMGIILTFALTDQLWAETGQSLVLKQIAPLRQDSVKVHPPNEVTRDAPAQSFVSPMPEVPAESVENAQSSLQIPVGGYDPSGRRDPFSPMLSQLAPGQIDPTLPPLQRVGLTDMNLIAVIWGAYGYTAMVQTPDGNGYTIRKGTRVGPNGGVVSAITEKGVIVQERFTDVYGRKQEREYVKLLHPKEGLE
ncbi:pilus assembly protein PilP [Petrachloros mirabilis]